MTTSCLDSISAEPDRALGTLPFRDPGSRHRRRILPRSGLDHQAYGDLAEGMVHDFNNVLAAISGYAELILHGGGADREYVRHILDAANAGRNMIAGLRRLKQPEDPRPERLDLREVLEDTLDLARGAMGLRIAAALAVPPHPVPVLGCRTRLQNAFINLFLNARDAMPAGGRLTVGIHRVEPRPGREGGDAPGWRISIRDTGLGMDGRILARLFERRFTTKGSQGSGHGLANVLATVRMHGGSIEVDSAPGSGTEFRISLPEAPAQDLGA